MVLGFEIVWIYVIGALLIGLGMALYETQRRGSAKIKQARRKRRVEHVKTRPQRHAHSH